MAKYSGGCEHVHTSSDKDPIDNHTCHCSVCKRVTAQATTHVVFFNHGDLKVDNMAGLKRQPFNDQNPKGPLELCTCAKCGKPIMLDDKQKRIRVDRAEPHGLRREESAPTYHAFYDPKTGRGEAEGRPPRLRRAASRVRLAERRTGVNLCGPHALTGVGQLRSAARGVHRSSRQVCSISSISALRPSDSGSWRFSKR